MRDGHLSLRDLDQVKVYVKPGVDAAAVHELCDEAFGDDVDLGFVDVDICRADLLVEIEGVARVPGHWLPRRAHDPPSPAFLVQLDRGSPIGMAQPGRLRGRSATVINCALIVV